MNEQLSQAEKIKEHLIVEIGSGVAPFLDHASPKFKEHFIKNPNILYFGLDIEPYDVEFAEETTRYNLEHELGEEAGKRFAFIEADGSQLPIKDNSADELILSNVLGDPRIDRDQGDEPGEIKKKMLQEAHRALKPGGYLTILEDTTPSIARRGGWIEMAEQIFETQAEYNESTKDKPIELQWTPQYRGTRDRVSAFVARIKKKI